MTSLSISDVIANNMEKFTQSQYPQFRVSFESTTITNAIDRDDGDLPVGAVHINEDDSLLLTTVSTSR